jgi:hypothetical protein
MASMQQSTALNLLQHAEVSFAINNEEFLQEREVNALALVL